uniref:Myosin light chain kinase 3-like n=1 Tax=Sinocyclocheilus anshuiensis TaxID=1608454 RepID=A0A671SZ87_9TELE
MYDGGRLENSGTPSGTVKKPSPTLIGSLSNVEVKLNTLEGKMEQIDHSQTEVLHKLSSLCQGMEALERSLKQQGGQESNVIKNGQRESNKLPLLTEVRSLCGETVDLLHNLKHESQEQRKKIECMESSLSTLEKVLGYVGDAFRNSKIVEFILNGVVPWRKQGLLCTVEEEVSKILVIRDKQINRKTQFMSLEQADASQVGEKASLKAIVPEQQVEPKDEDPQNQAEVSQAGDNASLKPFFPGQQLDKNLDVPHKPLLCTKEPFNKDVEVESQHEKTVERVTPVPKHDERKTETEPANKKNENKTIEKISESDPMKNCAAPSSQNTAVVEEVKAKSSPLRKAESQLLIIGELTLCYCQLTKFILFQPSLTGNWDHETNLTVFRTSFSKLETALQISASIMSPCLYLVGLGSLLACWYFFLDDSPPLPAPFEHRIVSAKQVPMNSYYAVKPNEVLGGGRFGQVHKCAELSSGLTLAAKIIKVRGMKERDEVKNEIGVMNQLNHVNLIQLYDAFESRTNLTLIMEYVEGGELFERIIDENYQLTELDAIVFTRQICEGVQYLHQQYILHLDLKPENILCVSSTGNQIKIIDFGLARKYRPREKLKVNFGTPEFLAPEVVNYDFVSFPTDMWSVGVITYMLLSGLSPFMGDNDTETMNNILHAKWDFDAEAFENVSEEAKDFISSLLVPTKCSRMSASGCMKHSWLNNLEDKAKMCKVRLKSQMRLQRYLAAHRQWKKHFYAVAAANRLKRFQQSRSVSSPNY